MKFLLYFLRWQASTPVLAVVTWLMSNYDNWISAMVANAIGACIFYWVDKWILGEK